MWYHYIVSAVYTSRVGRGYRRSYGVVIHESMDVLSNLDTFILGVKICESTLLLNIAQSQRLESIKTYLYREGRYSLIREEGLGIAGMRIVDTDEWDIAPRVQLNAQGAGFKPLIVRGWKLGVEGDTDIPYTSRLVLATSFTGLLSYRLITEGRFAWGRLKDELPTYVTGVAVSSKYSQLGDNYRRIRNRAK